MIFGGMHERVRAILCRGERGRRGCPGDVARVDPAQDGFVGVVRGLDDFDSVVREGAVVGRRFCGGGWRRERLVVVRIVETEGVALD